MQGIPIARSIRTPSPSPPPFDPLGPWSVLGGAGLLLVSLVLTACASSGSAPPASAEPVVAAAPVADHSALYHELDAIENTFQQGLGVLLGGEPEAGRQMMDGATQRLAGTLTECSLTPGCEVARFQTTLTRFVELQNAAIREQMDRVAGLEAEMAEPEVEEEPGTEGFAPELPELARTESLLRGTDLRQIIGLNGPIKAALDDWLTWMRPDLMAAYRNYQFLRPQMAPVFEEAGLPEALLFAMIATESGGKVHSYSRTGAAGPLQFMRYTGRLYGLKEVDGFDQRLDPEAATRAAVAYLNDRFGELNESLDKALAAYNGGEGRMRSLQRRYGDASLWDSKIYYSLPRETRQYVPRILAAAWLFLHPEDYNLEFPDVDAATTELTVAQEVSLSELTVCLGQAGGKEDGWFRTLRNLNPRLEPGEPIAAGSSVSFPTSLLGAYDERCHDGELLARARELHEANYPPEPEVVYYTVRPGDTLSRISARFGCSSVREIGDINQLRPPNYLIRAGQRLKIPSC